MSKKNLSILAMAVMLSACQSTGISGAKGTAAAVVAGKSQPQQQVSQILDDYFNEHMNIDPVSATYTGHNEYNDRFIAPISEQSLAADLAFEQKYLDRIERIDPATLSGQALLSYQVFKLDREMAIEGHRFPSYMIPINQMSGMHNLFAGLGSGKSAQPFRTQKDYDNFVKRTDGFVAWLDSAIVAMRQGIKQHVTLPKVLAKKMLPQFEAQVVENVEDSVFWMPVVNMPETFDEATQQRITAQYRDMINHVIIPAYGRMAAFLANEYIPAARDSIGYYDLPDGKQWYRHEIKYHTTMDMSPEAIHQIGLEEVARILGEMRKVKAQVGFKGDLPAFFDHMENSDQFYFTSEQQVIDAYKHIKDKIEQRIPKLFEIRPKAQYVVRAVEKYRAASAAGASYEGPSPDGTRPGVFYINTHNLRAQPKFIMETLSIHEAAPGHHFQIALQQEIKDLPEYRKFSGYNAFAEGWALYAESLGKEMGLFTDPYMWYGRLSDEQLRAMRLVVDTGMHAMGWTREQAIDYMKANSSMAESDIVAEVERYIAWPGQALSYKLGQRKIRDLRNYAEKALGEKFDVRKFHTQVLIDGSLPMPVLESKIKRWVEQVKKSA